MAPEMIEGNAYPQSDIWSLGVIVCLMLLGKHPFEGDTLEALFDNIKNKELNLYYLVKLDCSEESKDFIIKCLNKDYNKRITTSECLEHPWITKFSFRKNSNLINNETVDTLLDFSNKKGVTKRNIFFLGENKS